MHFGKKIMAVPILTIFPIIFTYHFGCLMISLTNFIKHYTPAMAYLTKKKDVENFRYVTGLFDSRPMPKNPTNQNDGIVASIWHYEFGCFPDSRRTLPIEKNVSNWHICLANTGYPGFVLSRFQIDCNLHGIYLKVSRFENQVDSKYKNDQSMEL